jgi:hypothetical protein
MTSARRNVAIVSPSYGSTSIQAEPTGSLLLAAPSLGISADRSCKQRLPRSKDVWRPPKQPFHRAGGHAGSKALRSRPCQYRPTVESGLCGRCCCFRCSSQAHTQHARNPRIRPSRGGRRRSGRRFAWCDGHDHEHRNRTGAVSGDQRARLVSHREPAAGTSRRESGAHQLCWARASQRRAHHGHGNLDRPAARARRARKHSRSAANTARRNQAEIESIPRGPSLVDEVLQADVPAIESVIA